MVVCGTNALPGLQVVKYKLEVQQVGYPEPSSDYGRVRKYRCFSVVKTALQFTLLCDSGRLCNTAGSSSF